MQTNKTHLASTLTLIVLGISILFLLAISALTGFSSIFSLATGDGDPVINMIAAFVFGFDAVILLISAWFVLQKARGREQANVSFKFPFALWQILVVIGLSFTGVLVGGIITLTEITWLIWLILPVTTVLVIVPPIWMFYGIGSNGIEAGPRWRFFAIFGLSMTIAPLIMIVIETVILLAIVFGGALYMAITQPELMAEITSVMQIVMEETSEQAALNLLAPYIASPVVILTGLGYISILVPLIEELLKPLAVWIFARQIESPAQGFVLGMLSGAAFGLIESLNASADGSTGWAVIVSARAGTGLLHMTTSGLVGWGILSAFKEKRIKPFAAVYFAAVLIHGIWNAAAAGAGISAIGESIGKPEWLINYAPAMLCGLLVLGVGLFAVLIAANRKIKAQMTEINPEQESVQLSS